MSRYKVGMGKLFDLVSCLLLMFLIIFCTAQNTHAQTAAAPKVLYTDIIAGPNSGGEGNNGAYLSIFGKNFGNNISNVHVYVGGGEVARYIYLGSSLGRPDVQQISVQLGSSAATGSIRVNVNGVDSNTDRTFTVRPGNFYYMSKTGNDSTGVVNDITHPYRTANYIWSITALSPGDFIIVRGGDYDLSSGSENLAYGRWMNAGIGSGRSSGNGPSNVENGTDDNHAISVQGYPGEFPVIDWGSDTGNNYVGIRVLGPSWYYVFADMIFDLKEDGGGAVYLGFYSYSGDDSHCWSCRLVNLRAQHGMNAGQQTGGVNVFELMRVDGLKMYGVDVGNQSPNANPALESHVIYLSHWYTNADLGWNYIHDNPYGRAALQVAGDGWGATPYTYGTLYGNSGTWGANSNVLIHDNLFLNLPEECVLFNLGSIGPIYLYNNIFRTCDRTQNTGFLPIALRGANDNTKAGSYYLFNNTIDTQASGAGTALIQMGYNTTWPTIMEFYNNIIVAVNANENYYYKYSPNVNFSTDVVSDYNLYFGSNQGLPPYEGSHGFVADPLLVNTGLNNFHLQSGSPARGAGTGNSAVNSLVLTDYDFNPRLPSYDIGALQYQSGSTTTPSPPTNLKAQ